MGDLQFRDLVMGESHRLISLRKLTGLRGWSRLKELEQRGFSSLCPRSPIAQR